MTEDNSAHSVREQAHQPQKRKRRSEVSRPRRYLDFQQALTDMEIAQGYQSERLTYEELAMQLGVQPKDGRIGAVDLIYACMYASLNAEVQALPIAQRLRIIHSANGVLEEIEELWGDRGIVRRCGN